MKRVTFSTMPPSANGMRKSFVKNGRVISVKSDEYVDWLDPTLTEIMGQRVGRVIGPYILSLAVQRHWRSKRARDIDNIIKPVSDALVKAGVVRDDSLAESVSAKWADDLGGPAVIATLEEVLA